VRRRARQTKSPNNNNPMGAKVHTQTWSVIAQATPATTRVQNMDNRAHTVVQTVEYGTVATSSSGADQFFATAFVFSSLSQVSSFQNLFDQYRFDEIEVWITPTYQNSAGGASNSVYLTVIDYDDTSTPSAIGTLLQYSNCIECSATTGTYRRWKPHVGSILGIPATSAQGIGNIIAPWIDSASSAVNHNGLKMAVKASNATSTYNLRARFTMSFRNVF
jgi:hypothetical protein